MGASMSDRPEKSWRLPFAREEYAARLRKVQDEVGRANLGALLCHSFGNICYLTGLQSVMGPEKYFMLVIPDQGAPFLLGQAFELHNANLGCTVDDLTGFEIQADPVEESRKLLASRGMHNKRLGLEFKSRGITPHSYLGLRRALPQADIVDASELVNNVRAIKSPAEIEMIRKAGALTSGAMSRALDEASVGKTDNDIAAAAIEYCVRQGGEFHCLEPIVSLGKRSGVPHCTFGRNTIRAGDLCFIEIGACMNRYSAALIRTVSFAEPEPFQRRVCDEIQASLEAVLENLRPGIPVREVAQEARKAWDWTFTRPDLFWNGAYGYSIGLGFPSDWGDADLSIREDRTTILQPGMVFHCTNNIRKAGEFGMGISETVAITEFGCELLTDCPRHLFVK
jgi:Xaa-Pro aminopeptidase